MIWIHSCQLCRSTDVNDPKSNLLLTRYLHLSTDGEPHLNKAVEDKRSPVTTWHVTMTTTSLATELPSAQPTDEWTKTPGHKSRQLDEIMTLDVVSPFIVDNSVELEGGELFKDNCGLRLCVQIFQCTINDCLRPQRTLDCERRHRGLWTGTWSNRDRSSIGTSAPPGTSATEYGTAGVHIELAGVGDLMPCDVTLSSPPLARSHSSARE